MNSESLTQKQGYPEYTENRPFDLWQCRTQKGGCILGFRPSVAVALGASVSIFDDEDRIFFTFNPYFRHRGDSLFIMNLL
jgi:hypothetical protein